MFAEFSDHRIRIYDFHYRSQVEEIPTDAARLNSYIAFADNHGTQIRSAIVGRTRQDRALVRGIFDQIKRARELLLLVEAEE